MNKVLKWIIISIVIVVTVFIAGYSYFIYSFGHNFVHDKPASPEYYYHVANRIGFKTKYRAEKLDYLLDSFLKRNPEYLLSDTIKLNESDSCTCNCQPFKRYIYFDKTPKEIYLITYDTNIASENDSLVISGTGELDIVFSFVNNNWLCIKSSKFDSTEKSRIENRLDTAILEKLK